MKPWRIAVWSAAAFTMLAIVVRLGLLDGLDSMVRNWVRPHDVWGAAQIRADVIAEWLRPAAVVLLVTSTLACCAKRRSLSAAIFVGGVCGVAIALTLASKIILGRLNPHGVVGEWGSFPSGHVIGVVVCLGLAVLVLQPRTGLWIWLIPALGGALMAAALLLQAAHWFTDIVGGALLATAILGAAAGFTNGMHNQAANDHESTPSGQSNDTALAGVRNDPKFGVRLNNPVPARARVDCYAPGREKFILRSCGGL